LIERRLLVVAEIPKNAAAKLEGQASRADTSEPTSEVGEGHYAAYEEHARTLRTWLVAYGIGGPVLILSQAEVWKRLAASGSLRLIASLFLSGVVLQVVLAAVNKSAMWACYYGELEPAYKSTRRYKIGLWLSERYLIDFLFDIAGMFLFAYATYLCFAALL
jgi:hypothetical protein